VLGAISVSAASEARRAGDIKLSSRVFLLFIVVNSRVNLRLGKLQRSRKNVGELCLTAKLRLWSIRI